MDEDFILIVMNHESAKRFARLMRMVGSNHPDSDLAEPFDQFATSLGSHMGISSNSDQQDELDEGLDAGDTIEWSIYDSYNFSDNAAATEERVTL